MNWNKWVRQTHRWLSIAFTVAVIINLVTVAQGKYSSGVGRLVELQVFGEDLALRLALRSVDAGRSSGRG